MLFPNFVERIRNQRKLCVVVSWSSDRKVCCGKTLLLCHLNVFLRILICSIIAKNNYHFKEGSKPLESHKKKITEMFSRIINMD